MRKSKKRSFKDLVLENKRELLKDQEAMEQLEIRLENRHLKNS
ncbi:FbpB family small basic protein [Pseudalkalibacillus sp. Hm43]